MFDSFWVHHLLVDDKRRVFHYIQFMQKNQRGFTLVELSIVLVILGLLVGGVLTGQSLIRAAELRSVTTQEQRYVTAVQTFRDKYFALPGDMTNATSYWGIVSGSTTGSDAACATSASTGAATCNGNGDGAVLSVFTASLESFRFWQHLANAGLIEGSYDGINHGGASKNATTSANVPSGKISSSLWFPHNYSVPVTGNSFLFDGTYDNNLQFGAAVVNASPTGALLKPEEVYNIDTKMDDGKPATGKVVVRATNGFSVCTTVAVSTDMTGSYLLSNSNLDCALIFRQVW